MTGRYIKFIVNRFYLNHILHDACVIPVCRVGVGGWFSVCVCGRVVFEHRICVRGGGCVNVCVCEELA